jgi:hypothetical protein
VVQWALEISDHPGEEEAEAAFKVNQNKTKCVHRGISDCCTESSLPSRLFVVYSS